MRQSQIDGQTKKPVLHLYWLSKCYTRELILASPYASGFAYHVMVCTRISAVPRMGFRFNLTKFRRGSTNSGMQCCGKAG